MPSGGVEAIAERPDGTRVLFIPYPTPLKDDTGATVGGVNVLVDITERKRVEEARARLAAIVETSDDAIISKTLDGVIQTWNAGAEQIFGYTPQEAIGQPVTMLIPSGHADEEPAILKRIRRGERIEHYETVRRRKDGSLLNISLSVSPVFDEGGRIVGASKIARDITQQKRAEAELRRANSDLEQFAYSASHDLKEPVRNVAVFADILKLRYGQTLDAKGKECLAFIRNSALRMDSLIKSLLTFLQSGDTNDFIEDIDTAAALTEALSDLATAMQETQARVTHDRLPILRMRGGQLKQLFQNLIANAIKYRRDREPPLIHITAECADTHWQFGVKDNGIGIPPEYKERIFGIFKRLHTDQKYTGTGIGLAICQRIVERHGGRVWGGIGGRRQRLDVLFHAAVDRPAVSCAGLWPQRARGKEYCINPSSGSACAAAAGLDFGSVVNDAGGSIRIPCRSTRGCVLSFSRLRRLREVTRGCFPKLTQAACSSSLGAQATNLPACANPTGAPDKPSVYDQAARSERVPQYRINHRTADRSALCLLSTSELLSPSRYFRLPS